MASVSDVEDALAELIAAQLYPTDPNASVLGYPVKIYPGWPDAETVDADMVETDPGEPTSAHVSIYPLPGERNLTRFPAERRDGAIQTPTYGIALAGQVVTITGAPPGTYFAHNFAVVVDGYPYIFQALAGHTAADVAAGLYALVSDDFPSATVVGAVITLPDTARMGPPRLGTVGTATREVRRQEKQFQIAVWSSNPASRAAIGDAFDPVLADTPFLTLADGSMARLTYKGSREDDFTQKQRIYRRSYIWAVEYATTRAETATQIIAPSTHLLDAANAVILAIPQRPDAEPDPSTFGTLDLNDPENVIFTTF